MEILSELFWAVVAALIVETVKTWYQRKFGN